PQECEFGGELDNEVRENKAMILIEVPLAIVMQMNAIMKGSLELLIEIKPFSNNPSNENNKVDICKIDDDTKREDVKGNVTVNKSEKRGMFEVKYKNDEYISISNNEIALNYNDKVNSLKML
ncbi:35905_t:CDS:1, partial [Racocetra persica]